MVRRPPSERVGAALNGRRPIDQLRSLLDSTPDEIVRTRVLYDLVQVSYGATKFTFPGGEGLDARDGDERQEIGEILERDIEALQT